MAEHKKLSMLVKLDDGQTYTLGGDSADNAVTLDTEQTITAVKTFDKLPQSSAKPANDHDLVNKVYVDALKPKLKTTVMLNVESETTNWAAFHSIKFSTTTGKFIEPVYLEDTLTSTAVEPLKFVFKLADSFTGNATAKNKDFFKDYQLQDGEYFGSFTPSHLLEARWSTHTSNQQANPFSNYLAYLTTGPNSVLPFLEYQFDGLSDELKQVEFDIGDIYNSNSYPPVKFQFLVSTGAKEFTSKVYTRTADGIGKGSHHTVEFKLKALEYVTLDTKQEITGAKTFTQNVTVTAKPKAATDVATVGYVSGLLNAKAPYDVTLDFKVESNTDGGWVVYSNMEINLDNGKKLKCIHLDNTQPTSANAPVKAVFKAIPATEVINAAPTAQAPTFFDTYQLQDEEYLGTLTYGHILNSQLQDYASYTGPFHTNQYGTTCTIKEATQLRITLSELPAAVSKVSLQFSTSYLPKTFKASLSGVGMDVTSNVLSNPSGNTPLELLFEIVKLTGLVTLDTAQTITGAKTFEVLPKSKGSLPTDFYELVNKGYVDALVKNAQLIRLYLKADYDGTASNPCFCGYHDLRLTLANGKHLVPLYLDQTYPADTNKPVQCVFKVADTAYTAHSVQLQAPEWFKTYQLKKDEVHGWVSYANILNADKVVTDHTYHTQDKPFDNYLVKEFGATKLSPALALELIGLSSPVKTISLVTGDTQNSGSYIPSEIKAECLLNFSTYVSKTFTKDTDSIIENTPISISFDAIEEDNESPNFVTLNTQQELTALKTFKVLPQSEAVPADDKDLVNKKYVDEKVGAGGGVPGLTPAPANMCTVNSEQQITAKKTFTVLPQSQLEATESDDFTTKGYVDKAVRGAAAVISCSFAVHAQAGDASDADSALAYAVKDILLMDGRHLVPKHVCLGTALSFNTVYLPFKVLYTISDSPYAANSATILDEATFNKQKLTENDVLGDVIPKPVAIDPEYKDGYGGNGKNNYAIKSGTNGFDLTKWQWTNTLGGYSEPETAYYPLFEYVFYKLPVPIYSIIIKNGSTDTAGALKFTSAEGTTKHISRKFAATYDSEVTGYINPICEWMTLKKS